MVKTTQPSTGSRPRKSMITSMSLAGMIRMRRSTLKKLQPSIGSKRRKLMYTNLSTKPALAAQTAKNLRLITHVAAAAPAVDLKGPATAVESVESQ